MKKRQSIVSIVSKREFPGNYILWEIRPPEKLEFIVPGQFISVLVENNPKVFLRRPFSIHQVDYHSNTIWFLMKMVGEGTRSLGSLREGDHMDILYPLGNGFSLIENANVLLVGGGYGIAPLYHLAEELIQKNTQVTFLFGAKTNTDLILKEKFEKHGKLMITTEDGSEGFKGMVTSHPVLSHPENRIDFIYTCGPEAMMYAVADIALKHNIDCELSLDHVMGCGIGVCLSCVAKTVRGHETSCIHGPVYNSKDLVW